VALPQSAQLYMAIALGSAIGGSARWFASELLHDRLGTGFPWGTLFVNVTGSMLIGFYAALAGPEGRLLSSPGQRQFVMAGLCGGYTTFSIFSLETVHLANTGHIDLAGIHVGVSVIAWLFAVWVGFALGTRFSRLRSE
jgi:fluoride exporter